MPPKKQAAATFFILDINTEEQDDQRDCFEKIFAMLCLSDDQTRSQDVYKVALAGTVDSENALDYSGIRVLHDWQLYLKDFLVDYLQKLYKDSKPSGTTNIYEAIYLACHYLTNDMQVQTYQPKRIVVLSDLSSKPPSGLDKQVDNLRKFLKSADIWLYVLGPHVHTPYLKSEEDIKRWSHLVQPAEDCNAEQVKNLQAMRELLHEGIVCSREVGIHLQAYYRPEGKAPFPWYAELTIGDQISFKVNVVKLVTDVHNLRFPTGMEEGGDEETKAHGSFEEVPKGRETIVMDKETAEDVSEWTRCYRVHGHSVVLSADREKDLLQAQQENEERCFQLKYFIPRQLVSPVYFKEESMCVVMADVRESPQWERALDVLAEAMHREGVAAIIKRVYNRGPQFSAKPHVLWPCEEHGPQCLLLAQWCCAHEHEETAGHELGSELVVPRVHCPKARKTVHSLLDELSVDRNYFQENGEVLKCLPDYMMLDVEALNQCQYFLKGHLMEKSELERLEELDQKSWELTRFVPEFDQPPALEAAAKRHVEDLIELLPELGEDLESNSLLYYEMFKK